MLIANDTIDKLLRLRKDLPHAVPCSILQSNFTRLIIPLFEPNQIVNQCLVKLQPSNIIQQLNRELENLEVIKPKSNSILTFDPRPIKRRGTYLANDEYGLLVDDMTTSRPHWFLRMEIALTTLVMDLNTLEFKPKWLAQSPSAPEKSKRCRQCAYVALQNAAKARKGEPLQKSFCPLDLVSDKQEDIFRVAEILLRPAGQHEITEFVAWISSTKLLRRLRDNQIRLDALGPLNADPKDERFRAAMTLRDVTVFLRYPRGGMQSANARIGDLDIKSPEKGALWKEKEMTLIDEGWYLATEKEPQPLVCSLSRGQDL
jgi:inositol-pentakisphosphate 2-kinase